MEPLLQKPKLLMIADTYYPKVDGTLKFMEEFSKRVDDCFEISYLVPNFGKEINQNISKTNISKLTGQKVTELDVYKHIKVSDYPSIRFSFQNLKKIKTAVQEADLVFVQGPALASYLGIYYAHKKGKKTVFYTHTLSWEIFAKYLPPIVNKIFFSLFKKITIMFYNRCTEIFVPYFELKEELEKEGVHSNIFVARLGVDIDKFSPALNRQDYKKRLGIDQNRLVVGFVGRVSKEKNLDVLLNAYSKLAEKKNMSLLIVGDGPEEMTKKFKEIENCQVTGFVNDVENYLKAMDIFVLPSLTETTSLATLEAMSCGLPVIATKVGFVKNYLVKNHNGLFFPKDSSSMLATKIEMLIDNQVLRKKIGENARRTVAYSFSWERSINKIKRKLLELQYNYKSTDI